METVLGLSGLVRRTTVFVVLAALVVGCTKWGLESAPLERAIAGGKHDRVRVTMANGERLVLSNPGLVPDSLVGWQRGAGNSRRRALPVDAIRGIEVRKSDTAGTIALVTGLGALVVLIAAASGSGSGSGDPPPSVCTDEPCAFSCPFVYSWDGEAWQLDSGTFGGAIMRPLMRTDLDVLERARSEDGVLALRLANELFETDHVDEIGVLAVDHGPGVVVAPDGDGRLHALSDVSPPLEARDRDGRDALPRVLTTDGWAWESAPVQRDTAGREPPRDGLELVFPPADGATEARLLVDASSSPWAAYLMGEFVGLHGHATRAWYDSLEADPERARRLGARFMEEGFLEVRLLGRDGWERQGFVWEAGPEVMKRQALSLDLSRAAEGPIRVRLESTPGFWLIDRVAIDYGPEPELRVTELAFASAVDDRGNDVLPLLASADGRKWTMERGDRAELRFQERPLAAGSERTYVLRSRGWYRIHTAETGEPDVATLHRIEHEPGAIARLSVARLNEALGALALAGARVEAGR